MQAEVSTLISFDEPTHGSHTTNAAPDLLQFGNTPQKPASKSSQSSQNSNFNIFGDTLMDFSEGTVSEGQKDSTDKIADLQEAIKKYEREINICKTQGKDLQMKFEKVKADLDIKTNQYEKMENETIKVVYWKRFLFCNESHANFF